jgi:hypothetical protein
MERTERTDDTIPSIIDEEGNDQQYDTIIMYDTPINSSFVLEINSIRPSINKTELSGIKIGKNGEITISKAVTPKREIDKAIVRDTPEYKSKTYGKKPRRL